MNKDTNKYHLIPLFLVSAIGLFATFLHAAEQNKEKMVISLKEAIELGQGKSEAILQNAENLKAAKEKVNIATANFFPTLTAEADAGTFRDKKANPGELVTPEAVRERNQYDGKIVLNQNLFSGYSHIAALKSSDLDVLIQEKNLAQIKLDKRLEIIKLYFGIQLNLRQLEAEREVSLLRKRQLDEIQVRIRSGRALEIDHLKAEYALKNQLPEISAIETDLDKKTLSLVQNLGLPLTIKFELTDKLENANLLVMELPLPEIAKAFEIALNENVALRKLDAEFDKKSSDIKISSAKHLPTVDLAFSAATNAGRRDQIGSEDYMSYGGMLKMSMPIFSGLSSFAEAKENQAELNALRAARAQKRQDLLEDLRRTYHSFELETTRIEAHKVNIELTKKSIKQAESLFRAGRARLTDVLDSYSNHLQAKKALAQAMYDRIIALAELKGILGK